MNDAKQNSILVVDDQNLNIMALTHILSQEYTVYAAKNGPNAIKAAEKHLPDVILLDIIMPEMDGYTVITALKNSEVTKNIPVIFLTGLSNTDNGEKGLVLGAADYITKPFSPAIVKLRVANQIKMINQLRMIERLSMIDQLTELPNRRSCDIRLKFEWNRARREQSQISILVIDVDGFKSYNDTYGHSAGDECIKTIAGILSKNTARADDFVARYGGDEFAVVLPNTEEDGARMMAEKILEDIRSCAMNSEKNGVVNTTTVSIGVTTGNVKSTHRADDYILRADELLYKSKQGGRDRCTFGRL